MYPLEIRPKTKKQNPSDRRLSILQKREKGSKRNLLHCKEESEVSGYRKRGTEFVSLFLFFFCSRKTRPWSVYVLPISGEAFFTF